MMTSGIWDHEIIVLVLGSHSLLVEMRFFFFFLVSQTEESKSLIFSNNICNKMDGCGDGILSLGFFIKNRLHKCLINLIIY